MGDLHWIEQLDQDHEVVRVGCVGDRYFYRVTPHRDRSWKLEQRSDENRWHRTPPTGWWKSPQAAMRAAEEMWQRSTNPEAK